jgi:type I restriction enzyme S subunit
VPGDWYPYRDKYGKLTKDEIKDIVVEGKWMVTLSSMVQSELDRISRALTKRIGQLNERYSVPLPKLVEMDNTISNRMNNHLTKIGALQHLLTGKKRLPGFTKEWKPTRLGDIGTTFGGLTGKTKTDFGTGSSCFIPFLNVITNTVIDVNYLEPVRVSESERQNKAKKGDLFFNGSSETPDEVGMCAVLLDDLKSVYLNSFCFGFRFREGMEQNGLYLAYYFRSDQGRKLLFALAQGAIRYNLSKASLLNLTLPLPDLKEQDAIATVFSDMDAEILALEKRRAKTSAIKHGVMQELLKNEDSYE